MPNCFFILRLRFDAYESQGKNYDQLIEDIIKAALDDYGLL